MNDYISRQAAIDTIEEHKSALMKIYSNLMSDKNTRERGIVDGMDYALADLRENVSSAQPEITDEQAIKHLQSSGWMKNHDKQMYEMGLKEQLADDSGSYDALLPSAQPENIRCYECKHGTHSGCGNVYICNVSTELVTEHTGDFYCGYAERREE